MDASLKQNKWFKSCFLVPEKKILVINNNNNTVMEILIEKTVLCQDKSLIISFLGVEFLNFQIYLSLSMTVMMKMLQHSLSWEIF